MPKFVRPREARTRSPRHLLLTTALTRKSEWITICLVLFEVAAGWECHLILALSSLQPLQACFPTLLSSHVEAMQVRRQLLATSLPIRARLQEQACTSVGSNLETVGQTRERRQGQVRRSSRRSRSSLGGASWKSSRAGLAGATGAICGKDNRVPHGDRPEKIGESSEVQTDQSTQFCECWEAAAVEDGTGGSADNDAQRATLPPILDRPKSPGLMDGMDQEVRPMEETVVCPQLQTVEKSLTALRRRW